MKKVIIIVFVLLQFSLKIIGQFSSIAVEWDTLINGDEFRNKNVIESNDGNIIVLGYVENPNENTRIVKIDKSGKILWDNTINEDLLCRPFNFIEDVESNLFVCGYSAKGGESKGGFLYKINKEGVLLWKNSFEKSRLVDLTMSSKKDGIYLFAETGEFPKLNNQILKIDFDGKVLWEITLPDFVSEPLRMTIFKNNIVLLNLINTRNKKKAISLTSIDDYGNLIWEKLFSADYNYYLEEILTTKAGDFLIVGSANNKGLLLKVNNNGNLMWEKAFPKGDYVKFYDIIELEDNSLIFTGLHKSNEIGVLWMLITSSEGELKFEKSIDKFENSYSWGSSLVLSKDKSIIISANTENKNNKRIKTWILMTNFK